MELDNKKDIRRGERHPFLGAVQVSWQNRSGQTRMIQARCLDMSDQGVRIVSEQPIELRTNVFVKAPAYGLMGNATVRYCHRLGLGHAIGLMFSSATSQADAGRQRFLKQDQAGEKR
ncbi:MAG TPA: PilZ domain-containing protein [Bryobacteraceae bacterium]|nr:PilZ domain-containing protein [Bryobacteraceae bacterium]